MSSSINNPHDKFFKQLMSNKQNARDFLQIALPQEVLTILNLEKIENDSKSYVSKKYQEYFTDLILKTQTKSKEPLDIYILLEHKSSLKSDIHLQLLSYMLKMWEQDRKNKQDLYPIIPVVFYHGVKKWTTPKEFKQIFKFQEREKKAMRGYLPNFKYELFNTSSNQMKKLVEIRDNLQLQSALLLMRGITYEEH